MTHPMTAQCSCGACKITLSKRPADAFYCHCSVCQKVYQKPFADVTVSPLRNVTITGDTPLTFGTYKPFPNIARGVCPHCKDPVIAKASYGPGLSVAFIPRAALTVSENLPPPSRHVFYATRTADVDDDLPKHMGDVASFIGATPVC